jgi:hypothetical protein
MQAAATSKFTAEKLYKGLYWIAAFLFFALWHYHHDFNSDEGVILNGAWQLFNNKKVYLDFFEITSPGGFYLICLVWKIFGVSYYAARIASYCLVFSGAVGVYLILKKISISHSPYYYFAPLFFLTLSESWVIINHNLYSSIAIIWAIFFWLASLDKNPALNIFISGIFAAFSTAFLQNKGVIFMVSLAIVVLLQKEAAKAKLQLLITFFAAPALLVLFAISIWPAKLLYYDLIQFPAHHYLEVNRISLNLFYYISAFSLVLLVLFRRKLQSKIIALFIFQCALLISVLSRPDWYHITVVAFPLIILSFYILQQNIANKKSNDFLIKRIFFIAICLIAFRSAFYAFMLNRPGTDITKTEFMKAAIEYCADSEHIYAGPFLPGFYFELRKANPTKYSILLTGMYENGMFMEAANILRANPPKCAILNYEMTQKFKYNRDNAVDNFIQQNYQTVYQYGSLEIKIWQPAPNQIETHSTLLHSNLHL